MLHVKLSQKAKNDLIDIWEYIFEKWSSEQADNISNCSMMNSQLSQKFQT